MKLPNYLCYFFALFHLFIRHGAYSHVLILCRTSTGGNPYLIMNSGENDFDLVDYFVIQPRFNGVMILLKICGSLRRKPHD